MARETTTDWKPTACILCECNCGLEVQLGGDTGRELVRIRGDKAHPASRGYACEKAHRINHYQNGPDRVTQPLRRRADGSFEPIDWDTAIAEVAAHLARVRDEHGGGAIFYYGGGGQGNHLPGAYSRSTLHALGSKYRSNALAQEKTGEFWVASKMLGSGTRADFEHAEVAIFLGKNPWHSHGISRARTTLKHIARDPKRTLVVIDPRRSETADLADEHFAVQPGTDAWLLAALAGTLVKRDLLATGWLEQHADGIEQVTAELARVDVEHCARVCGIAPERITALAERIASAGSVALFEDLGVQMNRHSTLSSYLERLVWLLTGHFGQPGCAFVPNMLQPIGRDSGRDQRSPVAGARIISGLVPCNVIAEEVLTDHPARYRAMIIEAANPAHSLADSPRMREALRALDCVVVIDVAMTETAREADYVLPTPTQYEKGEATFFNFEFPDNYFHFRRPLLAAPEGVLPEPEIHARLCEALGAVPAELLAQLRAAAEAGRERFREAFFAASGTPGFQRLAPVLLYRSLGEQLPEEQRSAAVLYALSMLMAMRAGDSVQRAGIAAPPHELGDALFDAILAGEHGVVVARDEWSSMMGRVGTPNGRIQLAIDELLPELAQLSRTTPARDERYPFTLSAGERRSFTANTIIRDPEWRGKDPRGALRMHPEDAAGLGLADGGRARITTERGTVDVFVELSDRMQPGHISLPNGMGAGVNDDAGGIATNELTASAHRDPWAGIPLHKHVPARVEALA